MIRRVNGSGGFAAILKKGADEAGAVHIVVRSRDNLLTFYRPAMQTSYDDTSTGQRFFEFDPSIGNDMDLSNFIDKEQRFDPDFWVVELETSANSADLPFEIMKP